ncbi:hypothetical protein CesoFtcFv8_015700 [Champsocephalus esox]|uniref:Uncharacterized protein n=1 Tax=Champsocephalus esox TaxID=159716 RepID=A0AAN8BUJ1_9TELE|nr:hypothetical protein CesoFtcFv8_015700 [Champsocephalus esox]
MGSSQPVGSSGPQLSPCSVSALSDGELHRRVVQPQQSMLSSHMVSEVGWLVGGSWAALRSGVAERRTGLQFRRQQQEESAAAGSERAWETEDDDEDGSWVGPAAPAASGSASGPGREEFRDLQTSVPVGGPFPQSDSGDS